MNFQIQVKLEDSNCNLTLDNNFLIVSRICFPLSFEQKICWKIRDNQLVGFEINDIQIQGKHNDLMRLRQRLGKYMTFTKILNMYQFCHILENGTFSQVCLLQCNITDKLYAVKCMKKRNDDMAYINKEIQIWKELNHRTIAQFFEIYESTNTIYIVMEKLNKLRRDYDHEEIKLIMREILEGLDYIHSKGIIHRDIKIENIMMDNENQVKIIDFGLSCHFDDPCKNCGTPGYVAPEVLKRQQYNHQCDLFSAGVVMYYLYFGKHLFNCSDIDELIKMNRTFTLSQLSILDIPDGGNQFIRGLLNPNPNLRFTVKQANEHWYLSSLKENPLISVPKSGVTKFKQEIFSQCSILTKTTFASDNKINYTK